MSDLYRIISYNLWRSTKRLTSEIYLIDRDPIPGIDVRANEDNILEWHFVIHGKEDTPYYGGMYHGNLIFPSNFPFSPPKIIFLTPNGRFKTNERICFSLSDSHPEEWKPAFSVTTVLQGVREFMHDSTETIGSIETSESEKRQLAESSSTYNCKNITFCHLFPQLCGRKEGYSENSMGVTTNSLNSSQSKITTTLGEIIDETGENSPSPFDINQLPSETTQDPRKEIISASSNTSLPHNIPGITEISNTPNHRRYYDTFSNTHISTDLHTDQDIQIEHSVLIVIPTNHSKDRKLPPLSFRSPRANRRQEDVEKGLQEIGKISCTNYFSSLCSLFLFCLMLLPMLFTLTGIYLKTIL